MFSKRYETAQQELKAKIPELEAYLTAETDKTENLQKFIAKVKKVTNPTELTPELVNEFIQKIVVSTPRYLDGKRYQMIEIHYKGVGIINIQTPDEFERDLRSYSHDQVKQQLAQHQLYQKKVSQRYFLSGKPFITAIS